MKRLVGRLPRAAVLAIVGGALALAGGFMLRSATAHRTSYRAYERCVAAAANTCFLDDAGSRAGGSAEAFRHNYENQFRVGWALAGIGGVLMLLAVARAFARKSTAGEGAPTAPVPPTGPAAPAAPSRPSTTRPRPQVALPTREPLTWLTPPNEQVLDPDYVEVSRMDADAYVFGDDEFEAVSWRLRSALCIFSGTEVRYASARPGEVWYTHGRCAGVKIALGCSSPTVRFACVDLRTLLVTNPELLRRQSVRHAGTEWRVVDATDISVSLTQDDRTLEVDPPTLVDENLSDFRRRAVLLVDVG